MDLDHRWTSGICASALPLALLTAMAVPACSDGREPRQDLTPRILAAGDITWIGHEMLGRPTDHSVTVKAIANQGVEAYVEYGTATGKYTGSTSKTTFASGTVEVLVDGLGASSLYYYRLRYRASGTTGTFLAGSEYSFHTRRSKGTSFTFAVQSDSHLGYSGFNDPALYQLTVQNIAAGKPDFVFDLGDAVSLDDASESESTVRTKYLAQRTYFEVPGSSAAIFLVPGNHENEEGWNLDDFADAASSLPVLGANGRKRIFVNPVPDDFYTGNTETVSQLDGDHLRGDYYAFEWGNALFVAIDPYWYTMKKPFAGSLGGEKDDETVGNRWDWTLGQKQYLWLKQTLEGSRAPLKFVFAHQLAGGSSDYGRGGALAAKYCEFGGMNTDGTTSGFASKRPGWDSPVHRLFADQHVTAFFHGHDHVYAKETLDGVIYQEVPMAANSAYDTGFSSNADDYAGTTLVANSGHLRVSVSSTGAKVEYVRSYLPPGNNGSIAETYTMQGCIPDADGDGTADCYDKCPNDVLKTAPGECGCGVADTDGDHDGTADCKDGCPNDPGKTAPGTCGCGTADVDSDHDGVLDCKDGCPQDAAKTAPGACGCGVADKDSDGDGVLDCKDGCPADPAKTAPGACGCGIPEIVCADECPNDPAKTHPGQCGCGVPDTDGDGDGTADCKDQCPADAQKVAPGLCGCGVADSDGDHDGTPDCKDQCPADAQKVAPGLCGCGVADTDGDGDGTPDCKDQCPADAQKVAPGACGCGVADRDQDGDGTPDCKDPCPIDPQKVAPGVCGCGDADRDADGNGVMDCMENGCSSGKCPCSVGFTSDTVDNTASVGSTIHFSANATCSTGSPSYQFRLLRPMATWQPLKAWGATGTLDWPTGDLPAGSYWIQVWARGANSQKTFDGSAVVLFKLR
jgi:hypothetical protein